MLLTKHFAAMSYTRLAKVMNSALLACLRLLHLFLTKPERIENYDHSEWVGITSDRGGRPKHRLPVRGAFVPTML